MTIKEVYGLRFYRKITPSNTVYYIAETNIFKYSALASHITFSDVIAAEDQIEQLNLAIAGENIQKEWGEVMGSFLEIFTEEGKVLIGDMEEKIPITEFKLLLQEWLEFIT